jgi:hypothetical protein
MDSKLPIDTLGKIWDLADMDKDGMLDRHEFMVVRIILKLHELCKSVSFKTKCCIMHFFFRQCILYIRHWKNTQSQTRFLQN